MIVDHEELMSWAQEQARYRRVRLEIVDESANLIYRVVARVFLLEPRCKGGHQWLAPSGCDCGAIAYRRLA